MKRALFILALAAPLHAANWPEHPQLHAVRVTTPPVIDGSLDDPAWQNAPEFTDFTQHDPDDMRPPTMRTSFRIVYDDSAIYFGAKMFDPGRPAVRLARRDTFGNSDFLSINLDPQLDRLSGNAFTISPANVQVDSVLYNDIGEDGSWDGVWESATKVVPDGWIAELRVPFSQLRFPDKPVQVWGINVTRRTLRNNELVRIVNTPKGQNGFVSHFADIVGIEGIRRGRPVELVPYTMGRSDIQTRVTDPLVDRRSSRADGGLDVKYGLNSSLTLTGTINPDFGQVEVDPAVVNLSQFETFYPEKRPFFTEGLNIFQFGDTPAPSHFNFIFPPSLFYTRRIGRDVDGTDARILAAAKVTGKAASGWNIGVLEALTDASKKTNYFVGRSTKEIGDGSRVGFMVTSVQRRLGVNAETAGVDGYTSFLGKSWILEGAAVGSRVSGTAEEITATQLSPAHYYQRPDADHFRFDPTRTSLSGWAGRAMLSRADGFWRPIFEVQAYSPGFETNDIGFMQRTDIISAHAVMQYVNQNPTKRLRERNVWLGVWTNRNFDGDTIERGLFSEWFVTTQGYIKPSVTLILVPGAFSDQLTRGGPVVRTPFSWSSDLSIESDDRKRFFAQLNGHLEGDDDGSYVRSIGVQLNARPSSSLVLQVEPAFTRSHDSKQYVGTFDDTSATATYGRRYEFAHLEQHSIEIATRADWTLTPQLSFQLYLQPFIAAGDYHDYRALAAARTRDYVPVAQSSSPDFNLRSVRGSAVVRWEFRPGSALFVAWNENRAGVVPIGNFRLGRDLRAIPGAPSHDVFMVKISYWLPMS
ncbi:MAG TPA: DUF5916 domain-containing protein [Thermoanaerobaculia bacterium]|nr:DUF5916 domain-containing protein [Thermoanaerobaculia bacterium]